MKSPTVYLAGRISGISYTQATTWRNKTQAFLEKQGFKVLNPMRGKESLSDSEAIPLPKQPENPALDPLTIFQRDVSDIEQSDILFARLDPGFSLGTPWEIGFAFARYKRIILIVPETLRYHPFVVGTTDEVFSDWVEGVRYLAANPWKEITITEVKYKDRLLFSFKTPQTLPPPLEIVPYTVPKWYSVKLPLLDIECYVTDLSLKNILKSLSEELDFIWSEYVQPEDTTKFAPDAKALRQTFLDNVDVKYL